jgi:hypothetical protein
MKTLWLQEAFPRSTFVVASRQPIMQALAVMKWGIRRNRVGLGLGSIVDHWFVAMDRYRDDAYLLERTMIIKFEDFLASLLSSFRALSTPPPSFTISNPRAMTNTFPIGATFPDLIGAEGSHRRSPRDRENER